MKTDQTKKQIPEKCESNNYTLFVGDCYMIY